MENCSAKMAGAGGEDWAENDPERAEATNNLASWRIRPPTSGGAIGTAKSRPFARREPIKPPTGPNDTQTGADTEPNRRLARVVKIRKRNPHKAAPCSTLAGTAPSPKAVMTLRVIQNCGETVMA